MGESSKLISAISRGAFSEVVSLLKRGVDPNGRLMDDDRSPLMHAAIAGDARIVKALIEHGADPEYRDDLSWTAVMYASLDGFPHIVKQLEKLERAENDAIHPPT